MNIIQKIPFIIIIFFVIISNVQSEIVKRDVIQCTSIGGKCMNPDSCNGIALIGLCPGNNNSKCCIQESTSTQNKPGTIKGVGASCSDKGIIGTCVNTSITKCNAVLVNGKCPGPSNIKCCLKKNIPTTTIKNGNKCISKGGQCMNPNKCISINGQILNSNLCPGGSENKCCVPKVNTKVNIKVNTKVNTRVNANVKAKTKTTSTAEDDEVIFLNIHKTQNIGDAIIIHSKGKYAMIDGGPASTIEVVEEFIKERNIKTFEWVLVTHFHGDHANGLQELLDKSFLENLLGTNKVKVNKVYAKEYLATDIGSACSKKRNKKDQEKKWNEWKEVIEKESKLYTVTSANNTVLNLGNYKFKLFNTREAFSAKVLKEYCKNNCCDENVNSIVATAVNTVSNTYYYFAGDVQEYPKNIQNYHGTNNVNLPDYRKLYPIINWVKKAKQYYSIDHFDVYKASHHGILAHNGGDNNTLQILKEINPDICVITTSSGKSGKGENLKKLINDNMKTIVKVTGDFNKYYIHKTL